MSNQIVKQPPAYRQVLYEQYTETNASLSSQNKRLLDYYDACCSENTTLRAQVKALADQNLRLKSTDILIPLAGRDVFYPGRESFYAAAQRTSALFTCIDNLALFLSEKGSSLSEKAFEAILTQIEAILARLGALIEKKPTDACDIEKDLLSQNQELNALNESLSASNEELLRLYNACFDSNEAIRAQVKELQVQNLKLKSKAILIPLADGSLSYPGRESFYVAARMALALFICVDKLALLLFEKGPSAFGALLTQIDAIMMVIGESVEAPVVYFLALIEKLDTLTDAFIDKIDASMEKIRAFIKQLNMQPDALAIAFVERVYAFTAELLANVNKVLAEAEAEKKNRMKKRPL